MNQTGKHLRHWTLGLALCGLTCPAAALEEVWVQQGQVFLDDWGGGPMVWNGPIAVPSESGNSQLVDGFSVAADGTDLQDTPAGKAIEFMKARDWLKAIEAIESLSGDDQRLVTDPNGVLRPLSSLKSALIASMPDEGKRVFRRLNDPAAKTQLKQARTLDDLGDREQAYQAIVRDYALCDAAAEAADTLGDLRFEQGRFDEAAALYRFAAQHPASTADDATLMAKRLIALSRAERWRQFDELAKYAAFRHGDTTVPLGGRDQGIRPLIEQLAQMRQADPVDPTPIHAGPLAMPTGPSPSFDQPLIDKDHKQSLRILAMNNRMGGFIDDIVAPVVVTDQDRIYTLALGTVARLDPQTGTVLWSEGQKPDAHVQSIGKRMYQLKQGYHQALVVTGDTLLAVVPDEQYPNRSRLIARDAETGKQMWDWRNSSHENWNAGVVGEPLVVNDEVYVVAHRPGEAQTRLVVISLQNGKQIRELNLGSASIDSNMGAPVELSPRLTMGQGYLFVQTNNGALIAIDPSDLTIAWALTQKIRPSMVGMMRRHGVVVPNAQANHTGTVIARNGIVIAKDTRSNTVHALREYDATPVWAAATDADATIVHADHRHVYVLGEELVAHDLRTGERVWWTPHAGTESGQPVFTDNACLLAGSQRLCRIDLTTGKLTDYTNELYERADLAVIGDRLIRVTSDRVTGFRLPDAKPEQP